MGKVYRAHDPILDRPVALKTVSPALLTGKDTLARFQREARAAARLQHPNIVTIFELGEVQGTHYIAMELLEGLDLGEAMTPPDRFTIEQKVRMAVDLCRGLDFAHKMGVIHRDVKPANIRLTRDGTVKILDFGIARFRGTDATDPNLTQQGMVLGTPSYLSPELVQGAKVDHYADMWAVGVILYEMLAGRRPFEAPTITSLIHRIVSEPTPVLDAKSLHLPEALAAVATRALDKDRSRRFADLGDMAKELLAAIGATPLAGDPARPDRAQARLRSELRGGTPAPHGGRPLGRARGGEACAVAGQHAHRDRLPHPGHRGAPARGDHGPAGSARDDGRGYAHGSRRHGPHADHAGGPPGPGRATRPARHRHAPHAGGGRLPRARHLRRAARHQGGGAVTGDRPARGGRGRRRHPALGPPLAQPGPRPADRPAPPHRPRRGRALPRLLARRIAPRLRPRGRGGAPLGHGEGRGGAGPPAPRRVRRDAGLLARRRDSRHGLARREPAAVGRRRRSRRRGAPRAGPSALRRHRPRLDGRRRVDPHRPLFTRPAPPRPAPVAAPRDAARARRRW